MKKVYTLIAGLMLTTSVLAQAPEKMSYQAVIRDISNNLITNQAVGMQISILQTTITGTAVYVEIQTPITNANGLVSIEIGTGTILSGDFATIDWGNDTYFIKTETDLTGGTNYTITGTSQLMSVPYALHSKTAESITGTITESDPVFVASVANGITAIDTAIWNSHAVDTDTHLDSTGVAGLGFIAGAHTVDTDTQLDSTAIASLGYTAGIHTANTDTQILAVSQIGDTLTINGGNSVLVPGISVLNYPPAGIGDFRDGGVVFWVDGSGQHGLVVSLFDLSTSAEWGCYGGAISGADGVVIGTGEQNTIDIELGCVTNGVAADLCANSNDDGYSDWFLPSIDELHEIYLNISIVNSNLITNLGTSMSSTYWSSTELNSNSAWDLWFGTSANNLDHPKSQSFYVRAIRAF